MLKDRMTRVWKTLKDPMANWEHPMGTRRRKQQTISADRTCLIESNSDLQMISTMMMQPAATFLAQLTLSTTRKTKMTTKNKSICFQRVTLRSSNKHPTMKQDPTNTWLWKTSSKPGGSSLIEMVASGSSRGISRTSPLVAMPISAKTILIRLTLRAIRMSWCTTQIFSSQTSRVPSANRRWQQWPTWQMLIEGTL